jgi:hypothetical protein
MDNEYATSLARVNATGSPIFIFHKLFTGLSFTDVLLAVFFPSLLYTHIDK